MATYLKHITFLLLAVGVFVFVLNTNLVSVHASPAVNVTVVASTLPETGGVSALLIDRGIFSPLFLCTFGTLFLSMLGVFVIYKRKKA